MRIGTSVFLALAVPCLAPPPASARDWSDAAGVASAAAAIAECLATSPEETACIERPYDACESETGTANPRDLDHCAGFAREAWRIVMDDNLARVRITIRPEYRIDVNRTQAAWQAWLAANCTLVGRWSEDGDFHSVQVTRCLGQHIAARALELTALANLWEP